MGNSTVTIQSVVDYAATIGDLAPVLTAGGYATEPALTIARDVMAEMIAERFNWKWNRMVCPPFYTNSWQQDYAQPTLANIGWLEHAYWVDINNTQRPKPIDWLECVRDLEATSAQYGRVKKLCWLPNDQLIRGTWPGAGKTYTNPLGAVQTPANPLTNILDGNGNLLVLTGYGVTGDSAPAAAANATTGTTVTDGTCVWTVADPKGQGFRLAPLPPEAAVVYQINVIAQAKAPAIAGLGQTLDPIPDDYAVWFRNGFIAYCHRHSANPAVKSRFEQLRADWLESLARARGQGDRERQDLGFVPDRPAMQESYVTPVGPAWPYGQGGW